MKAADFFTYFVGLMLGCAIGKYLIHTTSQFIVLFVAGFIILIYKIVKEIQ